LCAPMVADGVRGLIGFSESTMFVRSVTGLLAGGGIHVANLIWRRVAEGELLGR
jgi:uncharacterized membrane protein